jgi:hypothetical protein
MLPSSERTNLALQNGKPDDRATARSQGRGKGGKTRAVDADDEGSDGARQQREKGTDNPSNKKLD